MPNIPATLYCAVGLIVIAYLYTAYNTLSCHDLIRAHYKQHFLRCEHTILCQDVQDRMLGKESFGKVNKVGNYFVICVRPKRSKLKAITRLFALRRLCLVKVFDMVITRGIAVILSIRAV